MSSASSIVRWAAANHDEAVAGVNASDIAAISRARARSASISASCARAAYVLPDRAEVRLWLRWRHGRKRPRQVLEQRIRVGVAVERSVQRDGLPKAAVEELGGGHRLSSRSPTRRRTRTRPTRFGSRSAQVGQRRYDGRRLGPTIPGRCCCFPRPSGWPLPLGREAPCRSLRIGNPPGTSLRAPDAAHRPDKRRQAFQLSAQHRGRP